MRAAVLVAAAAAALGALGGLASGAVDQTTLVSRQSGLGPNGADGDSSNPSTSADGRFVAFESSANNLSADDNDAVTNVFVRDTQANTTALVSRQSGTAPLNGANGSSSDASISADGRFVAFASLADNLSGDDNDAYRNIFVRDLVANTTTLVSRQSGIAPLNGADEDSSQPSISADGRSVAFGSEANNLSGEDNDAYDNVFVRDLVANTTKLVSRTSGLGPNGGDDSSYNPSVSADGRFVAFESYANNLSGDDDDAHPNIFVRDTQANTTALVSRQNGTAPMNGANGDASGASISADGRFVAFYADADNLSGDDNDAYYNVFVRDLQANTTTLVSRQSGAAPANGANEYSAGPRISADGRFVAFYSYADNLSGDDYDAYINVFVRDLQANTTTLVSRQSGTAPMNGADEFSRDPSISADGRFVAFESGADNLSAEDNDAYINVFTRQFRELPSGSPSARCLGRTATRVGTASRNVIVGTPRRDVIAALGGSDVIRGRGGNDLICGGGGGDREIGGVGKDTLLGQAGADTLRGGAGRDQLRGGRGRDRLLGGAGRDRLAGGPGRDVQKQ